MLASWSPGSTLPRLDIVLRSRWLLCRRHNNQSFSSTVTGDYNPSQTVTWSISGNNSTDTTISGSGLLAVASDETAPTVTVTATSTVDSSKSAAVTVAVPQPPAALTPPSISGTPAVSDLLVADPGTWMPQGRRSPTSGWRTAFRSLARPARTCW